MRGSVQLPCISLTRLEITHADEKAPARKGLAWLSDPSCYLQDLCLGKASLSFVLLLTWQSLSGNPEEWAPGSPTVCLPAAFSEMEQHFKVSPAQPFTSQNMCLSLQYQLIFPYPHNIPIQHSLSWKSPIQRSPTCIQKPVIVLVLLLFSFQFRDYIS